MSVNASYEVGGKAFSATATVNLARLEIINPSGEYFWVIIKFHQNIIIILAVKKVTCPLRHSLL